MKKRLPLLTISILLFFGFVGYFFIGFFSSNMIPGKKIIPQIHDSGSGKDLTACYKNPLIAIYMYHYIRPDNENILNSTPYKLSILPKEFEKQMFFLKTLEQKNTIQIIFFSELQKYEKTGCYPGEKLVLLTSDDGWDDTYRFIFPIVKKYNLKFHASLIANRIASGSGRIDTFMNENEIKQLVASGKFEILSHTFTHPELPKDTEEGLRHELCDAKTFLEKKFNVGINTIVYPAGHTTPEVEKVAKKCGYHYGLAIKNKSFFMNGKQNDIELSRIRVDRTETSLSQIFRVILK